jgi:hypothetical protein
VYMTLSLGSSGVNYSMLDEIWDNYKYPNQDNYSCTGYDTFNNSESDKNINTYRENPNIQGQSVLSNKQPRMPEQPRGNSPMVVEGFQSNPMDHPSTSNAGLQDTYDNKPYDKNDIYSPVTAEAELRTRSGMRCEDYVEHVRKCRKCYDHLRKELELGDDTRQSLFGNIDLTNISPMQIAMLIVGGAFCMLLLDILITLKKR